MTSRNQEQGRGPAVPRFVVVSGLPASGKSTWAHRLSPLLGVPVLDKDDDLEGLFPGYSEVDPAERRALSRESDAIFRERVERARAGLVVSFWHLDGMPVDSGTPTEWLAELPGPRVHLWCRCPVDEAVRRFRARSRHPGHGDASRDEVGLREQLDALAALEPLAHGRCVTIDSRDRIGVETVAALLRAAARA